MLSFVSVVLGAELCVTHARYWVSLRLGAEPMGKRLREEERILVHT